MGGDFEQIRSNPVPSAFDRRLAYQDLDYNLFEDLPLQAWPAQWRPSNAFPTPQSAATNEFRRITNAEHSFSVEPIHYRLGDPSLPVAPYREYYLNMAALHPTVVASSETGSGKSTQFGIYHLEEGAPRIFVTQPRILAARDLMERARQTLGPKYAHLAGYITGNEEDSDCPPDARLIYVVERVLFNDMNRGNLRPGDRLVLDEAHERSMPMDFMLGLVDEIRQDIPDIGVTISSATIDTEFFAKHMASQQTGEPAPVMILPGRTYPITHLKTDEKMADVMRQYMEQGNVIGFMPGVTRMRNLAAKAQSRKSGHSVHVLYGDQSPAEQKIALQPLDKNHLVATRVGETSITPQGKNVVVDSGLSNVGRYYQGRRVLETVFSSKDTMKQRAGRVGRTGPGTYIEAIPEDAPPPPAYADRPEHETPDILNNSVASYIQELMSQGRRVEDLRLPSRPIQENLSHDYLVMRRLGAIALVGEELELTEVGRAMIDLPLDVSLSRMLIEARNVPIDEDMDRDVLRLQVAAAAAVQQVHGMLDKSQNSMRRFIRHKRGQEAFSKEQLSDVLFELDILTEFRVKEQELTQTGAADAVAQFERLLLKYDIVPNRYYKAVRNFNELCRREGLDASLLQRPTEAYRRAIINCQLAGAEELFVQKGKKAHLDIRGDTRTLGRRSTVAAPMARFVIGTAFDFVGLRESGRYTKRYIAGASAVTLEQLRAQLPHRLTERSAGYAVSRHGNLVERKSLFFDGNLHVADVEEQPSPTLATREALIKAMMTGKGRSMQNPLATVPFNSGTPNAVEAVRQWESAQRLQEQTSVNLNIDNRYESLIKKVVRESVEAVPLDVIDPAELDALIPKIFLKGLVKPTRHKDIPEIIRKSPDGISVHVSDETKQYVPVTYRHNIAYVTIERAHALTIHRDDFSQLLEHHDIKLRIGTGKYEQLDAAFKRIEDLCQAHAAKKERRERNRELVTAVASLATGVAVERERAPAQIDTQESKVKALKAHAILPRQQRMRSRRLIRSVAEPND